MVHRVEEIWTTRCDMRYTVLHTERQLTSTVFFSHTAELASVGRQVRLNVPAIASLSCPVVQSSDATFPRFRKHD